MYRIGQSIDIHQLVAGRKLILGGVEIEHERGLLGDIGKHFSDTDAQYKGISSLVLLEKTYEMMDDRGYEISNLDAIILIEKPKMAPHIQKMKENISRILKCDIADVNIKATRGEKLGFVGHEEGAVSQCVVMLKKKGI